MLDHEWIELILEAKQLGLSKMEVQTFLNENKEKDSDQTLKRLNEKILP